MKASRNARALGEEKGAGAAVVSFAAAEILGVGGLRMNVLRGPADEDAGLVAAPQDDARVGAGRACRHRRYAMVPASEYLARGSCAFA